MKYINFAVFSFVGKELLSRTIDLHLIGTITMISSLQILVLTSMGLDIDG